MEEEPDTTPAVAAISVVSVLRTGMCLLTADQMSRSIPAQGLAVVAVSAALIGVEGW